MLEAGAVGVIKTILIIVGVVAIIKVVGRMRSNVQQSRADDKNKYRGGQRHSKKKKNDQSSYNQSKDGDYVDYEVIDE